MSSMSHSLIVSPLFNKKALVKQSEGEINDC